LVLNWSAVDSVLLTNYDRFSPLLLDVLILFNLSDSFYLNTCNDKTDDVDIPFLGHRFSCLPTSWSKSGCDRDLWAQAGQG